MPLELRRSSGLARIRCRVIRPENPAVSNSRCKSLAVRSAPRSKPKLHSKMRSEVGNDRSRQCSSASSGATFASGRRCRLFFHVSPVKVARERSTFPLPGHVSQPGCYRVLDGGLDRCGCGVSACRAVEIGTQDAGAQPLFLLVPRIEGDHCAPGPRVRIRLTVNT